MDIKVTIKKKNRRKESSNIPWTTGIAIYEHVNKEMEKLEKEV